MNTRTLFAASAAFVTVLSGCSTLSVNKDQLKPIRTVAIVGFDVVQAMPPAIELSLGSKESGNDRMMKMGEAKIAQAADHATVMYNDLRSSLLREMHWDVLDARRLAAQPKYHQEFEAKTQGFQSRPIIPANTELYSVAGVLDTFPLRKMTPAERRQLMKDLGVDAVVVAQVRIELENTGGLKKLVGAGEYRPRATLSFMVYDRKDDKPIWNDAWARGEATSEKSNHYFGITKTSELNRLAVIAAADSYQKLMHRYKEAKN